jgi:hypothetical protein
MAGFKNEVSYSESAANLLQSCPRRYYYEKYKSWGGWWHGKNQPPEGGPEAEEAYVAKHVDNIAGWAGSLVHAQADWALKEAMSGAKWESREVLRNVLLTRASKAIDGGLTQARMQKSGNPKKRLQLIEVDLGLKVDEDWLRDRVSSRVRALTSLGESWTGIAPVNLFLRAMDHPDRIITVEDLLSYECRGLKVWFKIDLMMRSSKAPDECVVVDWKTGVRKDSDDQQVHQYASWATDKWRSVSLLLVYLGDGSTEVVKVACDKATSREVAESRVEAFKLSLARRLVVGSLTRNEPVPARFEGTDDPRNCLKCPHQRMCERDGTKPASTPRLDAAPTTG